MKILIVLSLLLALSYGLKNKLRQQSTPEVKDFADQDECKIQRCINSKMATEWEVIYPSQEAVKKRQVACFKICHIDVCKKRYPAGQDAACYLDEHGKEFPEDYNYFPTFDGLKSHLETRVEAPVEAFYNALMGQ